MGLALALMGAHAATNSGQIAALGNDFVGHANITLAQSADKAGNIILNGAACAAQRPSTI